MKRKRNEYRTLWRRSEAEKYRAMFPSYSPAMQKVDSLDILGLISRMDG
jgi:hypothetical protein